MKQTIMAAALAAFFLSAIPVQAQPETLEPGYFTRLFCNSIADIVYSNCLGDQEPTIRKLYECETRAEQTYTRCIDSLG